MALSRPPEPRRPSTSSTRSRSRRRLDPEQLRVPEVSWTVLERHLLRNWQRGQHVTLLGPTGGGKSHLAMLLGDMRRYTMVIVTKRHDEMLEEAERQGYMRFLSVDEIHKADGVPLYDHVLIWPPKPRTGDMAGRRRQAETVKHALSTAEHQRNWTIVIDETMWVSNQLGLTDTLDDLWFEGRGSKVSVVACAQRPSHVPQLALTQPTYFFIWKVTDRRDIERLREISGGVPLAVIEENVNQLDFDRHEFLFVDARGGFIARSVAPPR